MRKVLYVFAAAPFAIASGGWKLSVAFADWLGCIVPSKEHTPCMLGTSDVEPVLGAVAWWGMLLWMPCLALSGLVIGALLGASLPPPWGNNSSGKP